MPRANLESGAYRESQGVDRFDQLKLETGEMARLWIPGQDLAWWQHTHTLRVPVFREDGGVAKEDKTTRGVTRPVVKTEFLGRPICRGREEVIKKKELDVERCPGCAMVLRMIEDGISEAADMKPQMRLAVPVVRYNTEKKTAATPLQQPFGGKVLVWAMSPWTYKQLDETRTSMAELLSTPEKDFPVADVKLEYCDVTVHCENGGWQKYDRINATRCAWRHPSPTGQAVKAVIQALWMNEANRPTDEQLQAACGRLAEIDWLMRDLEDCEWQWRKAHGMGTGTGPDPAGGEALTSSPVDVSSALDDLDAGLFGSAPAPAAAAPAAEHPGGMAEFAAPAVREEVAAMEAAPLPAAPPADDDPFAPAPAVAAAPPVAPAAAPAAPPAADPAPAAKPASQSFASVFADLDI
jgi:hypothetical protein